MTAALAQLVDDDLVDSIAARSVPLPDEQSLKLALGPLDLPIAERSTASAPPRDAGADAASIDAALDGIDALDARLPDARPSSTVPPLPPGPRPRVPPPLPRPVAPSEPLPSFRLSDPPPPASGRPRVERDSGPAPATSGSAPSAGSRGPSTAGWLLLVAAGIVGGYVVGVNRATPTVAAASPAGATTLDRARAAEAESSAEKPSEQRVAVAAQPAQPAVDATASPSARTSAEPARSTLTTAATVAQAAPPITPFAEAEAPSPPPAPSGPDTAAMSAALASAAAGAASCPGDANTSDATVGITFSPSGDATIASVSAPASAAACVTQHFSGLRVPPFLGMAVTTYKSFRLASR